MKILAVDISNVFRRNWEAAAGREVEEAHHRTISAVTRSREGFDRVAICTDAGASFRKLIDSAYKAKREDPGAAYREQLERTLDRLRKDGCMVLVPPPFRDESGKATVFDYEADDTIGSLCAWATSAGYSVRILSADKDLMQLVRDAAPSVEIQKPDDGSIVTEAKVREKLQGLGPPLVADWLALAGDGTDGFKPFPGPPNGDGGKRKPGIGDVTALNLIKDVVASGSAGGAPAALVLFDLLALDREAPQADPRIKVTPHVRAILEQHGVEAAKRGLALATIHRDVPLDFSVLEAEAKVEPVTNEEATGVDPEQPFGDEDPPAANEPAAHPVETPPAKALARVEPAVMVERAGFNPLAIQPTNPKAMWQLAVTLFNARVYAQFPNPQSVFACILEAHERGIPAGAALRNAYVVKGKLAWSAAFIAGLVLASGKADLFEVIETTETQATVAYKKRGRPERTFTFTIEEARKAGWCRSGEKGDSKWLTNPRTMLRWAAIRECARFAFFDVVSGMYTPDELRGGEVLDAEIGDEAA